MILLSNSIIKLYWTYCLYFQLSKERERLEAMMVHLHMKPPGGGKTEKLKESKEEKEVPSLEKRTPPSSAAPSTGAPLKSRSPPSGPPPVTSHNINTSSSTQHTQNTVLF